MVYQRQEASTVDAEIWAEKHYNFMTPKQVSFSIVYGLPNTWVELSKGSGFESSELFGVTVIIWNVEKQKFESNGHKFSDFNKPFNNRKEARQYFNMVIETLGTLGRATI